MTNAVLLQHRVLLLMEPIGPEVAQQIVSSLLLLNAEDATTPIDLYLNCPGGIVSDALAILDTMLCISAPVSTICIGRTEGIAVWLLAAGSPGLRRATPHAEIVLSHPASGAAEGRSSDLEIYVQHALDLQDRLLKQLAETTGQAHGILEQDMNRMRYMTAEEAQRYGIIDAVLTPRA